MAEKFQFDRLPSDIAEDFGVLPTDMAEEFGMLHFDMATHFAIIGSVMINTAGIDVVPTRRKCTFQLHRLFSHRFFLNSRRTNLKIFF